MSKTRDQLIERVLKLLGAVAAGQAGEAEDQETVDEQIDPVLAELAGRRIIYVADASEYEDDVFNALAECVAVSLESDYGADLSRLKNRDGLPLAEERLKIITRRTGTGQMLKTDEFTGLRARTGYWDWQNG